MKLASGTWLYKHENYGGNVIFGVRSLSLSFLFLQAEGEKIVAQSVEDERERRKGERTHFVRICLCATPCTIRVDQR